MFGGVYSAATAMEAATVRHEVASQNLAHVNMPGYRRQFIQQHSFEALLNDPQPVGYSRDSLGTAVPTAVQFDLTQGTLKETGRALDVAIQGEEFFVVEGPEGPLYTRNGSFRLDALGRLVTVDGLPVRGRGGPIVIPEAPGSSTVTVTRDGRVVAGNDEVGQLDFARIQDPQQLQIAGASLFSAPPEVVASGAEASVVQGVLELSNVQPVIELVNILIGSRQYEAAQRAIMMMSDTIQQHVVRQNGG